MVTKLKQKKPRELIGECNGCNKDVYEHQDHVLNKGNRKTPWHANCHKKVYEWTNTVFDDFM